MRSSRLSLPLLGLLLLALLSPSPAPLFAQEQPPDVTIEWPNEGETLYVGPSSLLYSVPVRGHVGGSDGDGGNWPVKLLVLQNGIILAEQEQSADENGVYSFFVTVNPGASEGSFPAEQAGCIAGCHFATDTALPAGPVTLQVQALGSSGESLAAAERNITVDRSAYATVPVQVLLEGELGASAAPRDPVAGVRISAAARLYLWRARHELAATNEDGLALLHLEALRESSTEYHLQIEPTVVDGTLYTGVADAGEPAASVSLPPGASEAPTVTLIVSGQRGQIAGDISPAGEDPLPQTVWAICLPDGESFQTPVAGDAAFGFEDMPVDQYRFAVDPPWPALKDGVRLDLRENPQGHVALDLSPAAGVTLAGQALDETGAPLPFALAQMQNTNSFQPVLPADGRFVLSGLSPGGSTLVISAPGYYSRAQLIQADANPPAALADAAPEEGAIVSLNPLPDTRRLPWGAGEVVLPGDSQAEAFRDDALRLSWGWLWGENRAVENLSLLVGEMLFTLPRGRFAIEYFPESRGWFYLMEGEATVVDELGETVEVAAGQMVNLLNSEGLAAVAYEPVVVRALQSDEGRRISPRWEPSVREQIGNRLALIGVGAAQLITFVTYFSLLLSILLVPLFVLYLVRRRHRRLKV